MTVSREEARLMLKASEETGKSYSVMQNRRYQKPVRALKELVDSGRLGRLWMVSADIFVPEDLASIRNLLEKPMLQDNAIHTFDQARFITGEDPVSVYCHSYNPIDSKYRGDAAGACIFEMSGGTVFVYNCVMGAEGCHTSWESSWRYHRQQRVCLWDGLRICSGGQKRYIGGKGIEKLSRRRYGMEKNSIRCWRRCLTR
jgi:predicted dehydrogenase